MEKLSTAYSKDSQSFLHENLNGHDALTCISGVSDLAFGIKQTIPYPRASTAYSKDTQPFPTISLIQTKSRASCHLNHNSTLAVSDPKNDTIVV